MPNPDKPLPPCAPKSACRSSRHSNARAPTLSAFPVQSRKRKPDRHSTIGEDSPPPTGARQAGPSRPSARERLHHARFFPNPIAVRTPELRPVVPPRSVLPPPIRKQRPRIAIPAHLTQVTTVDRVIRLPVWTTRFKRVDHTESCNPARRSDYPGFHRQQLHRIHHHIAVGISVGDFDDGWLVLGELKFAEADEDLVQ